MEETNQGRLLASWAYTSQEWASYWTRKYEQNRPSINSAIALVVIISAIAIYGGYQAMSRPSAGSPLCIPGMVFAFVAFAVSIGAFFYFRAGSDYKRMLSSKPEVQIYDDKIMVGGVTTYLSSGIISPANSIQPLSAMLVRGEQTTIDIGYRSHAHHRHSSHSAISTFSIPVPAGKEGEAEVVVQELAKLVTNRII